MGKKSGGVRIKQVGKPGGALPAPLAPPSLEDFMIPPEEMIHLPPPTNKKYQIFFPLHETFTMKTETFQMIYPNYIDATKTIQEGRRLPLHILHPPTTEVDETLPPLSPTVQEISQTLQSLGIRHVLQPYKGYSRDTSNLGRCWVDMKSSSYANKMALLVAVAQRLMELPERQRRMREHAVEEERRKQEEEEQQRVAQATAIAAVPAASTATSGNSKKKQGHKKKK
jgi:signal recognition particle subunit SRP19